MWFGPEGPAGDRARFSADFGGVWPAARDVCHVCKDCLGLGCSKVLQWMRLNAPIACKSVCGRRKKETGNLGFRKPTSQGQRGRERAFASGDWLHGRRGSHALVVHRRS